ncbi:MAG: transporter [Candidatus Sulfotelmatobacter sp.]
MRYFSGLGLAAALLLCPLQALRAQDLAPRAYVIMPLHANAVTLTWSFYYGSINFNGALPVSDAKGTYSVPTFSYYHSFGVFGRSANIVAALPYGVGNFHGTLAGAGQNLYRSGLVDSLFRFSVNLMGGPAMAPPAFSKWKQKVLLGAGLKVIAPTGQYDPTKLINWGTNRWSFKPEFGYSQRWGKWVLDGYTGVWFFTTNHDFWSRNAYFPGTRSQSQKPIGAFEGHLSYDFKPRLWVSLDGNFWVGGNTSVAGIENPLTKQANSRLGGTAAFPISKHQSLTFGYSNGTYIRYGGNYQNVSLAWQYSWLGRPK